MFTLLLLLSSAALAGPAEDFKAKSYLERLELQPGASQDDIKRAYRRLVKKYHPDQGGDEEIFKLLNEANEKLKQGITEPPKEAPKAKTRQKYKSNMREDFSFKDTTAQEPLGPAWSHGHHEFDGGPRDFVEAIQRDSFAQKLQEWGFPVNRVNMRLIDTYHWRFHRLPPRHLVELAQGIRYFPQYEMLKTLIQNSRIDSPLLNEENLRRLLSTKDELRATALERMVFGERSNFKMEYADLLDHLTTPRQENLLRAMNHGNSLRYEPTAYWLIGKVQTADQERAFLSLFQNSESSRRPGLNGNYSVLTELKNSTQAELAGEIAAGHHRPTEPFDPKNHAALLAIPEGSPLESWKILKTKDWTSLRPNEIRALYEISARPGDAVLAELLRSGVNPRGLLEHYGSDLAAIKTAAEADALIAKIRANPVRYPAVLAKLVKRGLWQRVTCDWTYAGLVNRQ